MKDTKMNWAINRRLIAGVVAIVAIFGFSFTACDNGNGEAGNTGIDTTALEAVIYQAGIAREGVATASSASEVPTGRKWVTQSEWNVFYTAYKAAAETKENPSSQSAVDAAKAKLQAAITAFNAVKKDGSGKGIKLSGTITVKNNGKIVPYVAITAHDSDFKWWSESAKVHITGENTPWEIITMPFESSKNISFRLAGYDDDKYKNQIFVVEIDDPVKTVFNTDVKDIVLNMELNLITISGTFNFDYNGQTIPSVDIQVNKKDGGLLGSAVILNAGKNATWSMMIPSQTVDTDVTFFVVGFDGPLAWEYDQLFSLWGLDFGVTVKNQNKTGIAINLIKLSGTVSVTYKGNPPPVVLIAVATEDDWLGSTNLYNPSPNAPWSYIIPAFKSDTKVGVHVILKENENDDEDLKVFWWAEERTVKDKNVSGIAINFIELSGTISVTYKGSTVPFVTIVIFKKVVDGDYDYELVGSTDLNNPSANTPWFSNIPAFTSDTEILIYIEGYDENNNFLFWNEATTKTVKNTNVSGIVINLGNITGD